jgi:hypothetical protein
MKLKAATAERKPRGIGRCGMVEEAMLINTNRQSKDAKPRLAKSKGQSPRELHYCWPSVPTHNGNHVDIFWLCSCELLVTLHIHDVALQAY